MDLVRLRASASKGAGVIFPLRCYPDRMDNETKVRILKSAKSELMRHTFDTFVEGDMSVALGGSGVVVPGCPACRKRISTMTQFMSHLSDDILPVILRKAFEVAGVSTLK
jgi:hypothetical protein